MREEKAARGFLMRLAACSTSEGFSSERIASGLRCWSIPSPFPSVRNRSRSNSLSRISAHRGLMPLVAWLMRRTIMGRMCLPSAWK